MCRHIDSNSEVLRSCHTKTRGSQNTAFQWVKIYSQTFASTRCLAKSVEVKKAVKSGGGPGRKMMFDLRGRHLTCTQPHFPARMQVTALERENQNI